MKIRLTFKTPDVVDESIQEIENQEEAVMVSNLARKWIQYGEYITVEIDTEKETCIVVPIQN